jgi:BirA family biotin operon repressor/biotin-[acetyl-CoA-carboxylase] ligase
MNLVKLDAIDSTNEFLKRMATEKSIENFTVVTAENQTKGKGQMGAVWTSETGKNLIMSILVKEFLFDANRIFHLNIAVSVAIIQALEAFKIPKLSIKWPNDIMSDTKKIGGILIENSIKSDGAIFSIVGLGLNVNQTQFENLPRASSLALICDTVFDKEMILHHIVENMKWNLKASNATSEALQHIYTNLLFKKGIPMPFENQNGTRFMGIIQGITPFGKLLILLEDDTQSDFDIKEITMLY